jgi:hypothetical protein
LIREAGGGHVCSLIDRGAALDESALRCDCDGELSREHFLFCPKCRSTRLTYEMSYIT